MLLVRKCDTKQQFAMKILLKSFIIEKQVRLCSYTLTVERSHPSLHTVITHCPYILVATALLGSLGGGAHEG